MGGERLALQNLLQDTFISEDGRDKRLWELDERGSFPLNALFKFDEER